MSEPRIWQLIQRWMDGQVIRVNQSQLADAIGVGRQTITQWKRGETRPSPENLRRLSEVTHISYPDLTDALLRDLGYVTDEREDVGPDVRAAATTQAPGSGAKSDYGKAARKGRRQIVDEPGDGA